MDELDLFQPRLDRDRGFLSIAEVTRRARSLVEAGFDRIWVRGEVSGFKSYRSGHWYFGLRDRSAQVRCVMWRSDNETLREQPEDGIEVFAEVQPTVWEERGEFRLTVRTIMSTATEGGWQVKLEKARRALERDGLLDPARKRSLPEMPRRIALVTSPDGAALRDIVTVIGRRWPAELLLFPALVQGEAAARSLCEAVDRVNACSGLDLVIIGRGGGSREDLWPFNIESVARAVGSLKVPCISAVGHETDVTLTDLVADVRAATPSAAAETAVPNRNVVLSRVDELGGRLAGGLSRWTTWGGERLERTGDRLHSAVARYFEVQRSRLASLGASLDALSPLKVLERGYSVARDGSGTPLRAVADFKKGMPFDLTVSDGVIPAEVSNR